MKVAGHSFLTKKKKLRITYKSLDYQVMFF